MGKLKIGLYFNNFGFSDVDLSKPEKGNPGIGGTLFNFITLPYYFEKYFPNMAEWLLIGPNNNKLPEELTPIELKSPDNFENTLKEHSFDYIVWKPADNTSHIVPLLDKYKQSGIAWCNNVPVPDQLNSLATSDFVSRVVFAGHEALDLVRDHKIILKSTVIFNGFDPQPYLNYKEVEKDPNLVVYMGSLHPAKYFHLLAEAWPGVLAKNPRAKLTVVGSGKLYDRNQQLGPFGLAEASYEKKFTTPILNEEGKIDSSVNFAGLLGTEKIDWLKKASVGVINPHGNSEVCPGSAIEFQACETPVVAGARYGNLDTIQQKKTGLLVKNQKELINAINQLLNDPEKAGEMGREGATYITKKFSQQTIVRQWKELFEEIEKGTKPSVYPMKSNFLYNLKIVFEILRIIKFKLGIFKNLRSIYEFVEMRKRK